MSYQLNEAYASITAKMLRKVKSMSISDIHTSGKSVKIFWLFIISAFVVGTFLRLYLISEQILLDDGWHGMYYVTEKSFTYLLTHFSIPGASCIPMNLYRWLLLHSIGWSEILLRLPSLAAGILALAVFPVLLKKIFNLRVTIIFAFLLASSPLLTFYSRVSRPYSMVALFGFLSVVAIYLWASGGGRKYAVLYVVASVLSIYFHLFAAVVVLTPLGYVFLAKLIHKLTGSSDEQVRIVPGLLEITLAGGSIVILLSVLVLPSLILSSMDAAIGKDRITFESLVQFACILSGTANKFVMILFLGLLGFGQVLLLRKVRLLGGIFLSTLIMCLAVLWITGPYGVHTPLVISRYIIPVFILSYVLVALSVDSILRYFQSSKLIKGRRYSDALVNLIPAALLLLFFFSGPLIDIYAHPNNFTNHHAFQESYEPATWEQAYTSDMEPGVGIAKSDMPRFYQRLAGQPDDTVIIEYPMEISSDYNFYYFYQHFHKKAVIVGYITRPDIMEYTFKRKEPETELMHFATSGFYADLALCSINDTSKLAFKNMVDMMDIDAIRKSQADYVILHKNLRVEMNPFLFGKETPVYTPVIILSRNYREFFGPPFYEDNDIIVFKIRRE